MRGGKRQDKWLGEGQRRRKEVTHRGTYKKKKGAVSLSTVESGREDETTPVGEKKKQGERTGNIPHSKRWERRKTGQGLLAPGISGKTRNPRSCCKKVKEKT